MGLPNFTIVLLNIEEVQSKPWAISQVVESGVSHHYTIISRHSTYVEVVRELKKLMGR